MKTKSILLGLLALATLTACSFTESNSSNHQNSEFSSQSQALESSQTSSIDWQDTSISESIEEDGSLEESSMEESSAEESSSEDSEMQESASEEEKDVYYTVFFDTDGGSDVAAITVLKGEKIPVPEEPSKASKDCEYVFLGWYYNGEAWNFENGVVENMTLVARWKAKEYYTDPFLPKN